MSEEQRKDWPVGNIGGRPLGLEYPPFLISRPPSKFDFDKAHWLGFVDKSASLGFSAVNCLLGGHDRIESAAEGNNPSLTNVDLEVLGAISRRAKLHETKIVLSVYNVNQEVADVISEIDEICALEIDIGILPEILPLFNNPTRNVHIIARTTTSHLEGECESIINEHENINISILLSDIAENLQAASENLGSDNLSYSMKTNWGGEFSSAADHRALACCASGAAFLKVHLGVDIANPTPDRLSFYSSEDERRFVRDCRLAHASSASLRGDLNWLEFARSLP